MTLEDGEKRMNREGREEKQVFVGPEGQKDILCGLSLRSLRS
jgi:hypothetical protein